MGSLKPQPPAAGRVWWESTPALMGLIFLGAAAGTSLRATIGTAFPTQPGGWPWATFAVNVLGSFLLAVLLQTLARTGDDVGWRRNVRLGLGTGLMGGFTTYSAFVLEVDRLGSGSELLLGAGYGLVSVLVGLSAAGLGVALANRPTWSARGAGSHP